MGVRRMGGTAGASRVGAGVPSRPKSASMPARFAWLASGSFPSVTDVRISTAISRRCVSGKDTRRK